MSANVCVTGDGEPSLENGHRRMSMSPCVVALAERLIRGAPKAIVADEAIRGVVREVDRVSVAQQ